MDEKIKKSIINHLQESLNNKQFFNDLKTKYKHTFPKIDTDNIFHHSVNTNIMNSEIAKEAYKYMNDDNFESLPTEWVSIDKIVPTQKSINVNNLIDVDDVGDITGAFLVEKDGLYYVLDGHHRIANMILHGANKINAHIFKE